RHAGVAGVEARAAAAALTPQIDTLALPEGASVEASLGKPAWLLGRKHLLGLSIHVPSGDTLIVARGYDGALRLRPSEAAERTVTTVASGVMEGSLYQSAAKVGADLTLIARLAKLFSRRLDFARDIHPGDRFSLVFDRKVNAAGATIETGDI